MHDLVSTSVNCHLQPSTVEHNPSTVNRQLSTFKMNLRLLLILPLTLAGYQSLFAQSGFNYVQAWKTVDSLLEKKDLPQSALKEVNRIYSHAKSDRVEAQWVRAAIYRLYLSADRKENPWNSITEIEKEISVAPPAVASLLKSVEAEELYKRRYILNNTRPVIDSSKDSGPWDLKRIGEKTRALYLSSLSNPELLLRIPVDSFQAVIIRGQSSYRPSLYDLLAWRAVDFFQNDDPGFSGADISDSIPWKKDSNLFSAGIFFMHYRFPQPDTGSNETVALILYQQILRFHAKDKNQDAWIDADIHRIEFAREVSTLPEKDSLYLLGLNRIISQFSSLAVVSRARYLLAQWWADQADTYAPYGDTTHRFDYLKAVEICRTAIAHPDSSAGKELCAGLLRRIEAPHLSIESEHTNVPGLPFRLMVEYGNIQRLFGRMIRLTESQMTAFETSRDDPQFWKKMGFRQFDHSFLQQLPPTGDYQTHRTEMKGEALRPGYYILLTSTDSLFRDTALIALNTFFVSAISELRYERDFFALDRTSGQPLTDTKVKAVYRSWNKKVPTLIKYYTPDRNGHFRLSPTDENHTLELTYYRGDDFYESRQYIAPYSNQDNEDDQSGHEKYEKNHLMNYLYTDRSIYRPGQTVFFKGLLITRDYKTKKFKPAAGQKLTIFLNDANGKHIDSLAVTANAYGSVHGSFNLPKNGLNGEFSLDDSKTDDDVSFSVEEYKRPRFDIAFDSLKGSYRFGDSISISGIARAYAGNAIAGAQLSYRIYRSLDMPYYARQYKPYRREKEVGHGTGYTDSEGKFRFRFLASEENGLRTSREIKYQYRIETVITDANGETRSGSQQVSVGLMSFEIYSTLPRESRMAGDSLKKIPVMTRNLNGFFLKENLTVSLYKLKLPDRLIRQRYWQRPDQFIFTKEEYLRFFPHDEYDNETDVASWEKVKRVWSRTDSTSEDGYFALDLQTKDSVIPGWYVFEFSARDQDGSLIRGERYVEITRNGQGPVYPRYNEVVSEYLTAKTGDSVEIQTGSGMQKIFVVRTRRNLRNVGPAFSFFKWNRGIHSTFLNIRAADRGNVVVTDVFVADNRNYNSSHLVYVPWSNQRLQISYETWKNKTEPGEKESWKIKITGFKKEKTTVEVLSSMYDASLDQFKNQSWNIPDFYPSISIDNSWGGEPFRMGSEIHVMTRGAPESTLPEYDILLTASALRDIEEDRQFKRQQAAFFNAPAESDGLVASAYAKEKGRKVTIGVVTQAGNKSDSIVSAPPSAKTPPVVIRRDFRETAFFEPELHTDAAGNVEISFTVPEAMTRWKWMTLANSISLDYVYSEKEIVTQKNLMVQTNMPRFFRQGDFLIVPVRVVNLSEKSLSGQVEIHWETTSGLKSADSLVGNSQSTKTFSVSASQSQTIFFNVSVPTGFDEPLLYRVVAKTNPGAISFSDGEEAIVPVLSNRSLVTESMPLVMNGDSVRNFHFDKLLNSATATSLVNHALTVEYSTNPAWYAVKSLPYLMEFPHECAEQVFERFYANALASQIVKQSPEIQKIFSTWKQDTNALTSPLQKNQDLKSILLQETPWVTDAEKESVQKKNMALLFDDSATRLSLQNAIGKLKNLQFRDGGFPWFAGGSTDRYITQCIVAGFGKLTKLQAMPADPDKSIQGIRDSALAWLDRQIMRDFTLERVSSNHGISALQIHYLYTQSFFPERRKSAALDEAILYYRRLAVANWTKQPAYERVMIAEYLWRTNDRQTAKDIQSSLMENATVSAELGMYWKSVRPGYYWNESPVEAQAAIIELFTEMDVSTATIDQLKFWLLQQKHTSNWPTTKSTADACYALLLKGSNWLTATQSVSIKVGEYNLNSNAGKAEAGTGYIKEKVDGPEVRPAMGNIEVKVITKPGAASPPSWGAVYWQYFENMDRISSAATGLSVGKTFYIERAGQKTAAREILTKQPLKAGDKLVIRMLIHADRDLEYVHLKDTRAACLEPSDVLSGYRWQSGLGFYQSTKDASTNFFFDRIPKGNYTVEYAVFVTTAGNYSSGMSELQCMYAPEFAAHSGGQRITVESGKPANGQ